MLQSNHIEQKFRAYNLLASELTITNVLDQLSNQRLKPDYKASIPFSKRLNEFIETWFAQHWDMFIFTDEDDFNADDIEGTLAKHVERFKTTGKIHIWTGASDNTIFASPKINHYFRAWHDYLHVTHNLGYDFVGESSVCKIQQAMLPLDWGFERALVDSEIVGQALYFLKHGEFIEDQRGFTLEFIKTGLIK